MASAIRGAFLEVLDHFRPNLEMDKQEADIPVTGVNVLAEEEPGSVPERWLSQQRLARGTWDIRATFVDIMNSDLLANLNDVPAVRAVLEGPDAKKLLGPAARLDEGTIRLAGPVGRGITQAVSRLAYEAPLGFAGISYITRYSTQERCWAIYDDRLHVEFDAEEPLDATSPAHLVALDEVARKYGLVLPANWRL